MEHEASTVARLQAELEAWQKRFPAYVYRPQDEVVALRLETCAAPEKQEELDRMSREACRQFERDALDARRYRWLRDGTLILNYEHKISEFWKKHNFHMKARGDRHEQLDAAIDAALESAK